MHQAIIYLIADVGGGVLIAVDYAVGDLAVSNHRPVGVPRVVHDLVADHGIALIEPRKGQARHVPVGKVSTVVEFVQLNLAAVFFRILEPFGRQVYRDGWPDLEHHVRRHLVEVFVAEKILQRSRHEVLVLLPVLYGDSGSCGIVCFAIARRVPPASMTIAIAATASARVIDQSLLMSITSLRISLRNFHSRRDKALYASWSNVTYRPHPAMSLKTTMVVESSANPQGQRRAFTRNTCTWKSLSCVGAVPKLCKSGGKGLFAFSIQRSLDNILAPVCQAVQTSRGVDRGPDRR